MSLMYASDSPGNVLCRNSTEWSCTLCQWTNESTWGEENNIEILKRYSYGIALPIICLLGIFGNVLNLIVLTRRNMRGTAYIYMRAYSAAALLAIVFAIPFAWRVLIHRDKGRWENASLAYYHAHLELFLGNGCLGVGVIMLLALTIERYFSVCHPGYARPILGSPKRAVAVIPIATFLLYLPAIFRSKVVSCRTFPSGLFLYQRAEVPEIVDHPLFNAYTVLLELLFKVIPIVLLAVLNLRILVVYRRSCEKRRKMTLSRTSNGEDECRKFAEERRLIMLLGSTSVLFLVCVSPMVILNITLSDSNLKKYRYQVFRALANLLEITNYSITFYIYCMFSEDFRNTLIRTIRCVDSHPRRGFVAVPASTGTTTLTRNKSMV